MALNKKQKELLSAAQMNWEWDVFDMLADGANPKFPKGSLSTPLHEAVRNDNSRVVRALLENGADPLCQDRNGETPLALARRLRASSLVIFLLDKPPPRKAKKRSAPKKKKARVAAEEGNESGAPKFSAKTLPDIFNPKKWAGNASGMIELWEKVPKNLQKDFNIAAVHAEAQRQSIRQKAAATKIVFKKAPPAA